MKNTYIAHHGIMKQQWGVRNGPPYPLKNSQRSKAERNANKESKSSKEKTIDAEYREIKSGKSPSLKRQDIQTIGQDADRAVLGISRLIPRKKVDLSEYSDAELQKIVNRQRLEQQYNQLNPDVVEKGANYIREGLQTAGALAGLYLTYKTVKTMKG